MFASLYVGGWFSLQRGLVCRSYNDVRVSSNISAGVCSGSFTVLVVRLYRDVWWFCIEYTSRFASLSVSRVVIRRMYNVCYILQSVTANGHSVSRIFFNYALGAWFCLATFQSFRFARNPFINGFFSGGRTVVCNCGAIAYR